MAAVWAIADLHLSFGVPNKKMDIFGDQWRDHPEKIKAHWLKNIGSEDLVLLAGDISWAKTLEEAAPDLQWIGSLPGTKVMIRGNHDYWWSSITKLRQALPPSLHCIQNDAFTWGEFTIAGARLWDSEEYSFGTVIHAVKEDDELPLIHEEREEGRDEKIFERELLRLEQSLKQLNPLSPHRIAMTHYPPIGLELAPSRAGALLEKYQVESCLFGHLHNVIQENPSLFGKARGVDYRLTAADFLDFKPLRLY